jgi:hypothetical protein
MAAWRVTGMRPDGSVRFRDHDTEAAARLRADAWRERGWQVSVRRITPSTVGGAA